MALFCLFRTKHMALFTYYNEISLPVRVRDLPSEVTTRLVTTAASLLPMNMCTLPQLSVLWERMSNPGMEI